MNELRKQVFFALTAGGAMNAKTLGEQCGLSAQVCLRTARQLCALGLVREKTSTAANGKKQVRFAAAKTQDCALGIHIEDDKVTLAVVAADGSVKETSTLERDADYTAVSAIEVLLERADRLINVPLRTVCAIGVTCPGPMRQQLGFLRPVTECGGFDLESFEQELNEAFELPVVRGFDSASAGEYFLATRKGAARGVTCCVDAGSLITAATFVDGREIKGNGHAGLIAHMGVNFRDERCYCGNRGCLEGYASTSLLRERLQKNTLFGIRLDTFDDTVKDYASGDPATVKEVDTLCASLAMGLVNLVWTLEPSHLYLVGDLTRFPGALERTVHAVIKQRVLPESFAALSIEISQNTLDEYAAGAALAAFGASLAKRKK